MSPKAPRLTGIQLAKKLHKQGFATTRIRGSHHFLKHPDGRATVIPIHRGETVGPGLLSKILRDVDLTFDDLR